MAKSEKFSRAGYRIHFDRLKDVRSAASAIRTHKFKCEIPSKEAESELKGKFDDVAKVVDSSGEGSLLWFLTQLYGLGFLFVSKEGKKTSLLKKLYGNSEDENLVISSDYGQDIRDQEAFADFVTKSPRSIFEGIKNDFLPQSIIKALGGIFEPKEKISAQNLSEYPVVKKCHDELLELVKQNKRLNQSDLQEFFGIKIDALDTGGTTFVIQEIPLSELKYNSENEVDIYKAFFRYLSSAAIKTEVDVQSLAGVSENQNALANLFNKSLIQFQKSAEDCGRLITYGNPEFFQNNPETLDFLSTTVHNLASKISPAQTSDFIASNWGEYRNLLGGRLQGWLSNFQKRIEVFGKTLSENGLHQNVFEKIKNNCDFENIFPTQQKINFEKLQEIREQLDLALKSLKGQEAKYESKDFGTLLNEYEEYLRDFREFLMKWNNEGIPSEVGENKINFFEKEKDKKETFFLSTKELCEKKSTRNEDDENEELKDGRVHKWSKSAVPQELEKYPRFIGEAKQDPETQIKEAKGALFPLIASAIKLAREIKDLNQSDFDFDSLRWLESKGKDGLFHKNLETIKNLAVRYDRKEIETSSSFKFINKFTDLENTDNEDQKKNWKELNLLSVKFFVSGYEYRNNQRLTVKPKRFSDYLTDFEDHFNLKNQHSSEDFRKWLGIENGKLSPHSSEHGEVLKIYFSLLLRNLPKQVQLPQHSEEFKNLEDSTLSGLLFEDHKLRSTKVDAAFVQRFFAAGIGSNIRSKISLISRKEFIKRNVIQITNGGQSLLRYVPIEWGNFDHLEVKKIAGKRTKFTKKKLAKLKDKAKKSFSSEALLSLESGDIDSNKSNLEIAKQIWKGFGKWDLKAQRNLTKVLAEMPHKWEVVLKTKKPIEALSQIEEGLFIEKSNEKNIFKFCTKKSDYLYSFPIQTSVYQKQFLESFLWGDRDEILAERIAGSSLILEETIKIGSKERDFAMYLAIPFQFEKEGEKLPKGTSHHRKTTLEKQNLLGIDLGEYGFGWAVFNPESEKFIAADFLKIPLLPKMRAEATAWKDTQAKGIFSRPTTHLADIREQAAGQIRNQIHNLALQYGAMPIYEDSVDGFESGGQRISKLYKTLKTADVISGGSNKADEAVRKHFWGTEYAKIGGVIGASKTSQTCRCCGRCATSEVNALEGNHVEIRNKKIVGTDISCEMEDGEHLKKDAEAIVKKSQRFESKEEKESRVIGKKHRGTVDKFKCQICKNETDADKQAAQNIALKFYFRKFCSTEEDEKNPKFQTGKDNKQFSSLKFFLEKSKEESYLTKT